jgi:hypothetical protein
LVVIAEGNRLRRFSGALVLALWYRRFGTGILVPALS